MLLTKLYSHDRNAGSCRGPRLMESLDRSLGHKLTVISTLPGYGRSTLGSQWLDQSHAAGAWASLDDADNDPASFFNYLLRGRHRA